MKIILLDNDDLLRNLIVDIYKCLPECKLQTIKDSGEVFGRFSQNQKIELYILDNKLNDEDSVSLLKEIKTRDKKASVLVLSDPVNGIK
jgi:DNA-binding NarL/FixJ family response regulator